MLDEREGEVLGKYARWTMMQNQHMHKETLDWIDCRGCGCTDGDYGPDEGN